MHQIEMEEAQVKEEGVQDSEFALKQVLSC